MDLTSLSRDKSLTRNGKETKDFLCLEETKSSISGNYGIQGMQDVDLEACDEYVN